MHSAEWRIFNCYDKRAGWRENHWGGNVSSEL